MSEPRGLGETGRVPTPAPDRRLPFTFVEDLDALVLPPAEHHHLARVRRLRGGDPLTVGDGAGRFRAARFGDPLAADGPIVTVPAPRPAIAVAFALTKGDKPELVVQKLVEIGVDAIVPFVAGRSVVRWDDAKATRNVDRWRAIAREAAAQAHRPHLASVEDVTTFAEVAARAGATLAHPDGPPLSTLPGVLLVGPEGGWSAAEEAAVEARIGLGPHVLRAETAALVAGALAVAARSTGGGPDR
jgi:16S rRNA (uracil1498-N3)-methyltransferase